MGQYGKCIKCINNGKKCKIIMAEAISLLAKLERLINYSQSQKNELEKCILKIDFSCENFNPRSLEDNINNAE